MLGVKYQSKRIGEIRVDQMTLHAKSLLVRINTITGWRLPDDEYFLNVLVDEFQKFLVENYSDLNPDEIGYAFRTYGTTVKDWGKSMNLSLIDEPIRKYLSVRQCLSEIEERKKSVSKEILHTENTDWKELCEMFYQQYLSGKYNLQFFPSDMYEEFVKAGMLAVDVYEDFMERAKGFLIYKKKQELADEMSSERENIQSKLADELQALESGNEQQKIIQQAKRYAIQYLYYKANESGYKNLFVKEN